MVESRRNQLHILKNVHFAEIISIFVIILITTLTATKAGVVHAKREIIESSAANENSNFFLGNGTAAITPNENQRIGAEPIAEDIVDSEQSGKTAIENEESNSVNNVKLADNATNETTQPDVHDQHQTTVMNNSKHSNSRTELSIELKDAEDSKTSFAKDFSQDSSSIENR